MTWPVTNRPAAKTITATLPTGSAGVGTFQLSSANMAGGGKLIFETVDGLTGTIQLSYDGTTFFNIPCTSNTGTNYIAGETITFASNMELAFEFVGASFVRVTRVGGTSGIVKAVAMFGAWSYICFLLQKIATALGAGGSADSAPVTMSIRVLDSDGAQTNVAMVTVSAGTIIVVKRYSIKMDGSNTGPVNATLGFAAATLATPNTTSGAGILEDFLGCSAGQGVAMGDGGSILGMGASGEDLRYTMEDPAGGAGTITVTYVTRAA